MCYRKAYHSKWGHHPMHKYGKMARKMAAKGFRPFGFPPVNVKELDDTYELHVFAPGYEKGDFQVNLKDRTLIIEVDKKQEEIVDSPNWRRKEYSPRSFRRLFELNKKIDIEAIAAEYKDGILLVKLPKLPGMETVTNEIVVA